MDMKIDARIRKEIDTRKAEILDLSRRIHAHPELAFQEVETSRRLRSTLETAGFAIEHPLGSLDTAFRAVRRFAAGRPRVTFTAEMDALPGLGHACGHNIIGTASPYAAIVLGAALGPDTPGTIEVVGTPAEEKGSGKVLLLEDGVFANSDVVLQVHPHKLDSVICQAMGRRALTVEFFGKKAHAAASPKAGINALDALVLFYHSAIIPRTKVPAGCLIHGIIEDGGEAPNVIPDYARGRFSIRADTMPRLDELYDMFMGLVQEAAAATGCRYKVTETSPAAATFKRNSVLEALFADLFEECGRREPYKMREFYGSTDLANVSWLAPTIEPMLKTSDFSIHTEGFAGDAIGPGGEKALLDAVFCLAAAAARILTEPDLLARIKLAFEEDGPTGADPGAAPEANAKTGTGTGAAG